MIRLVSQFDAPRARAQVASPKSSACSCCCCCCVATALTSSILTARAIGRVPPSDQLMRDAPAPLAATPATPATPVPLDAATAVEPPAPAPKLARPSVVGWKVFGFFFLGLCVALASAVAASMRNQAAVAAFIVTFFGSYLGGLLALRRWVGLHGGWIIALVIGLPIAVAIEVAVWIGGILK